MVYHGSLLCRTTVVTARKCRHMLATTRRTNTNNANHATKRTKTKIPEPTWSVQGLHLASNQHSHNNDNEEQDDEYYEVLAMRSGLPPSCVSQTKHSSNNNRTNVAQMMQFLSMLQKRQQQQQQDSIPNHDDDDDESIMERGSLRLRTAPQQDSSTRRFTDTHDPDDEAAVDPEWKSVWNAVLQSNKLVRHPTTEENIGSGEEEETLDYFSVPKTHDPN